MAEQRAHTWCCILVSGLEAQWYRHVESVSYIVTGREYVSLGTVQQAGSTVMHQACCTAQHTLCRVHYLPQLQAGGQVQEGFAIKWHALKEPFDKDGGQQLGLTVTALKANSTRSS